MSPWPRWWGIRHLRYWWARWRLARLGVSFGLQHVQLVRDDGTRYDGRKAAKDVFGAIDSANDSVNEADVVGAAWATRTGRKSCS